MKLEFGIYGTEREIYPGVVERIFDWGWVLKGSREALISAGLAAAGMFPGEPGQLKTVGRGTCDGRPSDIMERWRRVFAVRVYATEDEKSRNRDVQLAIGHADSASLPKLDVFDRLADENQFLAKGIADRYRRGQITCEEAFRCALTWLSRTTSDREVSA